MFKFFGNVFLLLILNEFFWINDAQICTEIIRYPKEINFFETYTEKVKSNNCNIILRLQNKCFATITQSRIGKKTIIATRENQVCCKGYLNINDICEPICSDPCFNSKCTAPDFCTCNPGYDRILPNKFRCDPVCQSCNNGICVSPENCVCAEGYEKNNTTNECVPRCNSCENGNCIRPGECECNKGYKSYNKSEQEHICIPICEPPCKNSDCVAPNKCNCHEGYKYDNDAKICNPICTESCVNSDCISPNLCKCWEGFSFHQNSTNICKSIKCLNGIIDENGLCNDADDNPVSMSFVESTTFIDLTSTNNYEETSNDDYDSVCNNGYFENGSCKCDDGYHLETDLVGGFSCESDCDEDCHNAICTGINKCTCLEGFQQNNTKFECFPICTLECINGFCVSPNQCECYDGFQHSYNESLLHVCEPTCGDNDGDDCINGTCISPNVCKCFDGFELSSSDTFNCVQSQDNLNSYKSTLINKNTGIILSVFFILLLLIGALLLFMKFHKRNYNVDAKENPLTITYTK